jgi:hypothetical protein
MEENIFFIETFFFIHVIFLQKLFKKKTWCDWIKSERNKKSNKYDNLNFIFIEYSRTQT